jgi:leucyl aminopeptidase
MSTEIERRRQFFKVATLTGAGIVTMGSTVCGAMAAEFRRFAS